MFPVIESSTFNNYSIKCFYVTLRYVDTKSQDQMKTERFVYTYIYNQTRSFNNRLSNDYENIRDS